ncbi:MAG: ribosome assembly RNA-binding protein YhbY [Clostridia bacterium]|nr:ribosome assembly RNA-binding protein YhbY [Clostridia bacterium]
MFTSKQRSNLRSIASTLEPIMQVGKGGVSDNMIESLALAIEKRELVKISVLQNADDTAEGYALVLAKAVGAEVVAVIGKKIILYKRSDKQGVKHIEF